MHINCCDHDLGGGGGGGGDGCVRGMLHRMASTPFFSMAINP